MTDPVCIPVSPSFARRHLVADLFFTPRHGARRGLPAFPRRRMAAANSAPNHVRGETIGATARVMTCLHG